MLYSSRSFRRTLTSQERVVIRNSGNAEMGDLRDELGYVSSFFDTSDPYLETLIRAIPGIATERADELINGPVS